MNFLLKILIIILPALGCEYLLAQTTDRSAIDSMTHLLGRRKEDTNKVKLMIQLSSAYRFVDNESGILYGKNALQLATSLGWKKGMADALLQLANNYTVRSEYPLALADFYKALEIYNQIGKKAGSAEAYRSIAYVYRDQGDYNKALEFLLKAFRLAAESGDKVVIARSYEPMGSIYKHMGNYAKALEYYFKGLQEIEEAGITNETSILYGDVGEVYILENDGPNAMRYEQKALDVAVKSGEIYAHAWALLDLGKSCMILATDTVHPPGYTGRKINLQNAVRYLEQALVLAKQMQSFRTMRICYENLAQAYRLNGDYKKALENSDIFRAILDSVFSRENSDRIARMEYNRKQYADSLRVVDARKSADLKLQQQKNYTYLGVAGILLLSVFSFFIIRERGKSEKLLLNILPREVADELKSKGVTKARHYDNVTVIFTDFINFTKAGERMSPQELIDELHACFKAFDEIAGNYGIEKIKTIGDAWLAVCGLPKSDSEHAEKVVKAAMEMTAFMQNRQSQLGDKTFSIRIGIHSGSVVAGIVGVKKFAYDIWGDAVNTAARMEQNSEAAKVNISQTTYDLVKDKFTCIYRGEIEAKNKGALKMYYVAGQSLT